MDLAPPGHRRRPLEGGAAYGRSGVGFYFALAVIFASATFLGASV